MTSCEQIKQEAATAIVLRLLVKRFQVDPEGFEPLLDRLDFVQYEDLSERILVARSLEEILAWLEGASHN